MVRGLADQAGASLQRPCGCTNLVRPVQPLAVTAWTTTPCPCRHEASASLLSGELCTRPTLSLVLRLSAVTVQTVLQVPAGWTQRTPGGSGLCEALDSMSLPATNRRCRDAKAHRTSPGGVFQQQSVACNLHESLFPAEQGQVCTKPLLRHERAHRGALRSSQRGSQGVHLQAAAACSTSAGQIEDANKTIAGCGLMGFGLR